MYPTKMEANGRIYNINTDYRVALACFKALYDDEITDLQRFYAIETLLLGSNVLKKDELILRDKITIYLKCGRQEEPSNSEVDFDYLIDERRVKISIKQVYGIDVDKLDYLHWYEYNELIEGLTSDCLIDRARQIRNKDIKDIKDSKLREQFIEAKTRLSVKRQPKMTKEQKEAQDEFFRLLNGGVEDV